MEIESRNRPQDRLSELAYVFAPLKHARLDYIVQKAEAGDLVITGDIPLASLVLAKGAMVLNPRGERYTPETIGERLAMRDMMEELRSAGIDTGGPSAFNQSDRRAFGNALDRLMMATS